MFSRALNVRRMKLGMWIATLGVAAMAGHKLLNIVDAKKAGLFTPKARNFFDNIIASAADTGADVEKFEPQDPQHYTRMWDSPINGFMKVVEPETRPEDLIEDQTPALEPIDGIVTLKTFLFALDQANARAVVEYKDDVEIVSNSEIILRVGAPLKHPYDEEPFLAKVVRIQHDGVVVTWGGEETLLKTKGHGEVEPSKPSLEPGASQEETLSAREQELLDKYRDKDESIKLSELGNDHYMVGQTDRQRFAGDYDNLHSFVRVSTQDAPTGGKEVVFRHVKSNIGRTYGVQNGDVLISINGTEVSSKSQAINYVRNNPDLPKYTVVIRRTGKEVTKTIYVPRDDG